MRTAIVTGATGQDGRYLVPKLLAEGWRVVAAVRDVAAAQAIFGSEAGVRTVRYDLRNPESIRSLVRETRPDELYNLAGFSSVGSSFDDPLATWEANAHAVVHLLDAVRRHSPETRVFQAASGEIFGATAGGDAVHDEGSRLDPQSPYAAAKASAFVAAHSFRTSYDVPVASGILFNHESHLRGPRFLSRKVVTHVLGLSAGVAGAPLAVGNLKSRRDWGFAPDYVEGMIAMTRADVPRDYVLATGRLHHVWELVDRAFALGGHELDWQLDGDDPLVWGARFRTSGALAVVVDPAFIRRSEPHAIGADPGRAREELGWIARPGLDVFLEDMLSKTAA